MMNQPSLSRIHIFSERVVVANLWKFYLIGAVGVMLPATRAIFIHLTPFFLWASFGLIIFYEYYPFRKIKRYRLLSYMLVVYLFSLAIEMIGVASGSLFGTYSYGRGLGVKVLHTPVLIGVNWLILSLGSAIFSGILSRALGFLRHRWLDSLFRILVGCVLMMILDLVMEQVAPLLDLWNWRGGIIPDANYRMWFLLSLLFQGYYVVGRIQQRSYLSAFFFLFQFLFFLVLWLYTAFR